MASEGTLRGMSGHELEQTPQEVAAAMEAGDVQLVDVREPDEWAAGRIPGATHVPLGEVSARAGELDKDRPVVFQCLGGVRSLMAAEAFAKAGYEATSMAGGIKGWQAAGLPVDGEVADH
jgi:rhodanese-related sulfurtransferase